MDAEWRVVGSALQSPSLCPLGPLTVLSHWRWGAGGQRGASQGPLGQPLPQASKTVESWFYRKDIEKTTKGAPPLLGPCGWGGAQGMPLSPEQLLRPPVTCKRSPDHCLCPLPLSEAVWSETITIKTRLASSVGSVFFSLTYDRFHHMLPKKMQERIADKFMSTANCSVSNLFIPQVTVQHPLSTKLYRQSGLGTCSDTQQGRGWLFPTLMITVWNPQTSHKKTPRMWHQQFLERLPFEDTLFHLYGLWRIYFIAFHRIGAS